VINEISDRTFRTEVLLSCSASTQVIEEVLAYTDNSLTDVRGVPGFPLPDEPHIEAWARYEREAGEIGVLEALRKRFVQLRFPVREGISKEPEYRSATRKGHFHAADSSLSGIALEDPEGLQLVIFPTIAGGIPVIVAAAREDFVALVRAFTKRNEPAPVPDSMGACIVTGFNNWDRIASYRRAWEQKQEGSPKEVDWQAEFRALVPRKELYQDRFIILSRGPYSAVGAADVNFSPDEWLDCSLTIRREHEFTHYFTYRILGAMRSHLLDEVIADFVGLVRAFGTYRPELALLFLGLESFPRYRQGGRLESYCGQPPLSDPAIKVLRCLVHRAIGNLDLFAKRHAREMQDLSGLARLTFALACLTLEELASAELAERAAKRLRSAAIE
jgi:hypothetical protein